MKRLVILVAAATIGSLAWAQASIDPVLDGKITAGEYSVVQVKDGFTVAARLSSDGATLRVAVSAATEGWIAIGLGSKKMNGSFMIMGYVADGKPNVSYELGKGYSHAPVPAPGANATVVEVGGVTTLEAVLPAKDYVKGGLLDTIAALGARDDFRSKHSKRTAHELRL